MQKKRPIIAYVFTVFIALAAVIVIYQSLSHLTIYANNSPSLMNLLIGKDLITLCIGTPLLLITGFMAVRNSRRAYLSWLGILSYYMITYLSYSCGIAYNRFFLCYLVIFALSLFSLIRGLIALDAEIFCLRFSPKTPVKFTAFFMLVGGFLMVYQWLNPMVPAIIEGKQPDFLHLYGTTQLIYQVLNLGFISPLAIITSFWVWKRKPWGYITTSILLLYSLITEFTFLATQWIVYNHGQPFDFQKTIIIGAVTLFILILWLAFIKNLREESLQDHRRMISTFF